MMPDMHGLVLAFIDILEIVHVGVEHVPVELRLFSGRGFPPE